MLHLACPRRCRERCRASMAACRPPLAALLPATNPPSPSPPAPPSKLSTRCLVAPHLLRPSMAAAAGSGGLLTASAPTRPMLQWLRPSRQILRTMPAASASARTPNLSAWRWAVGLAATGRRRPLTHLPRVPGWQPAAAALRSTRTRSSLLWQLQPRRTARGSRQAGSAAWRRRIFAAAAAASSYGRTRSTSRYRWTRKIVSLALPAAEGLPGSLQPSARRAWSTRGRARAAATLRRACLASAFGRTLSLWGWAALLVRWRWRNRPAAAWAWPAATDVPLQPCAPQPCCHASARLASIPPAATTRQALWAAAAARTGGRMSAAQLRAPTASR